MLALLFSGLLFSSLAHASNCASLVRFTDHESGEVFLQFDRGKLVHVTGSRQFPLEVIGKALGQDLESEQFRSRIGGKKILSVGEGYSSFVPQLRSLGADAVGVDVWYHLTDELPHSRGGVEMRKYVYMNQNHLVSAGAEDLPFPNDSFDEVYANFLFGHLDEIAQMNAFEEIGRVLKTGGRAFITQFRTREDEGSTMKYLLNRALHAKNFNFELEEKEADIPDPRNDGDSTVHVRVLLTHIQKIPN